MCLPREIPGTEGCGLRKRKTEIGKRKGENGKRKSASKREQRKFIYSAEREQIQDDAVGLKRKTPITLNNLGNQSNQNNQNTPTTPNTPINTITPSPSAKEKRADKIDNQQ